MAVIAIVASCAVTGCGSPGTTRNATSAPTAPLSLIAVGNTWKYKVTGGSTATETLKVTAVTPVTGGKKVTLSGTVSTAPGKVSAAKWVEFIHSNGSVTLISGPRRQPGGQDNVVTVTSSGGTPMLPPAAIPNSGKPVKLAVPTTLKGAQRTYRTIEHITIYRVGLVTVTVPAGTYRAILVRETERLSLFGYPVTIGNEFWYVSGVGTVQETLSAGTYAATVRLTSFSKGRT
jgi:hypothetical protein